MAGQASYSFHVGRAGLCPESVRHDARLHRRFPAGERKLKEVHNGEVAAGQGDGAHLEVVNQNRFTDSFVKSLPAVGPMLVNDLITSTIVYYGPKTSSIQMQRCFTASSSYDTASTGGNFGWPIRVFYSVLD